MGHNNVKLNFITIRRKWILDNIQFFLAVWHGKSVGVYFVYFVYYSEKFYILHFLCCVIYIVIRKLPDATQHKEKPHYRRCIASYISYCVYRKYRMLDGGFLCYGLRIPRKLNTTSRIILVQSKQNKNSIRMGESSLPQTKKMFGIH